MRKKILAVLLAVAMVTVCIPAISAIPDEEPTEEEVKKIVKKQMESESKGWVTIPNGNSNGVSNDSDIAPELYERYQDGRTFRVKYDTYSTNENSFTDTWDDYYWTDDDTSTWNIQYLDRDSETIYSEHNYFENNNFQAPKKAYLDMNIIVDEEDDIGLNHDSDSTNNYDEEYMYFWWIG